MARGGEKRSARRVTAAGRRYGGLTPNEREADRRRRLVAAGLELFGTVGLARTTIQAVCSRARVTARNFYDHFASLEDLLAAVYEQVVAQGRSALLESLAHDSVRSDGRARRALQTYLHAMLDDPRRARVQCIEVVGVNAALESRRRAVIHDFAGLLKRERLALGFEELREDDAEVSALMFVAGVDELLIECVMGSRYARPIDDLAKAVVATMGINGRHNGPARSSRGRPSGGK
jgi:AcrR family transcriptional regulator